MACRPARLGLPSRLDWRVGWVSAHFAAKTPALMAAVGLQFLSYRHVHMIAVPLVVRTVPLAHLPHRALVDVLLAELTCPALGLLVAVVA